MNGPRIASLAALALACRTAAPPRPVEAARVQIVAPDAGAAPDVSNAVAMGFAPEGEVFPSGACAGFESVGAGEAVGALAQRVQLRLPRGMSVVGIGAASVMAAPLSQQRVDRASLDVGDGRMVVTFDETFRRAGAGMLGALRATAQEGDERLRAWRNPAGLRVVMTAPRRLDAREDAVAFAEGWVAMPDDLVVAMTFYVNRAAATRAAGCPALAQSVLDSVTAGTRAPSLAARALTLAPGLTMTVAEGMVHSADEGHDFTVHRVEPVSDLGSPSGELGVYLGHHPQHNPRRGATDVPGALFGRPTQWSDSTDENGHFRQTWAEVPSHAGLVAHVFVHASDAATFDRLMAVAQSLTATPTDAH